MTTVRQARVFYLPRPVPGPLGAGRIRLLLFISSSSSYYYLLLTSSVYMLPPGRIHTGYSGTFAASIPTLRQVTC